MTVGVFVVLALATYRLTRLVVADEVSRPLRDAALRRWPSRVEPATSPVDGTPLAGSAVPRPSWPVVFVNCSWCVGLWIAAGLALVAHALGYCDSWGLLALVWFAIAAVSGLLQRVEG